MEILLVEDNPADVKLTAMALASAKLPHRLSVAEDGEDAMSYLRRQGRHTAATRPDLILLDLNLPRMHGWEVLSEIRRDPNLRRIPVCVLSTSSAETDIAKSYDLQANCYAVKPFDAKDYVDVIHQIEGFWGGVVETPP